MKLARELSGKVVLLIFTVFIVSFIPKIFAVINGEDRCVCSFDAYGYYMYLPHFFNEGNLNITKEWAQQLQSEYCNGNEVYQIKQLESGKELNIYHIGQSFVELPAYLLGDLSARAFGYKSDGFSTPYYLAFLLNALFFIFLGLLYLRKLLLLYFDERATAIAILVLFGASNIYITFVAQFNLQHLYLFTLNTLFLYYLLRFLQEPKQKHLYFAAILLGLTVAIRPTQVILGVFPLIVLFREYGISWMFIRRISLFPIFGLLWNIPQFAYWYFIGNEIFVPNLHSEKIALFDGYLSEFLFSYKKGWLVYSPIFILSIHGAFVLYSRSKSIFLATTLSIVLYIWVMSSWECWWYAQSYGSRVMVDIYPIFAVLLGFSISSWRQLWSKLSGYFFIVCCIGLNFIQTHQCFVGYLSYENMTKEHYWYIFGRTHIPNYTASNLELDRSFVDPNWIIWTKTLSRSAYSNVEKVIYEKHDSVIVEKDGFHFLNFQVLKELPNDEGMIRIELESKTSDPTTSALLMVETYGSDNWYYWNPIEISIGHPSENYTKNVYYLNIQHIRHFEDQMQFYIAPLEGVKLNLKSVKMTAFVLVRK